MACTLNDEQLFAYTLGELDESSYREAEQHLLRCRECLEQFLAAKRDLDLGRRAGERPSAQVRQSILKGAMRQGVGVVRTRRFALVLAGAAAAGSFWLGSQLHRVHEEAEKTPAPPAATVDDFDSGRVTPGNLTLL